MIDAPTNNNSSGGGNNGGGSSGGGGRCNSSVGSGSSKSGSPSVEPLNSEQPVPEQPAPRRELAGDDNEAVLDDQDDEDQLEV